MDWRLPRICKGSALQIFLFHWGTHGLFEELGRHANKDGLQECPNRGACKESAGHVLFESSSYDSQRQIFTTWSNFFQMLLERFFRSSAFDKAVFCLGEKQHMLVKDECIPWYNRVGNFFLICIEQKEANFMYEWWHNRIGDFLLSIWNQRKQILFMNGTSLLASQTNHTPECMINGTVCYGGWV